MRRTFSEALTNGGVSWTNAWRTLGYCKVVAQTTTALIKWGCHYLHTLGIHVGFVYAPSVAGGLNAGRGLLIILKHAVWTFA